MLYSYIVKLKSTDQARNGPVQSYKAGETIMASSCKTFVLSADEAAEDKEACIKRTETVENVQVYTLKQGTQEFVTPNYSVDRLVLIGSGEIEVKVNSAENNAAIVSTERSLRVNGANLFSISAKHNTATFSIFELKNSRDSNLVTPSGITKSLNAPSG